jgi:hypothetical protein
MGTDRYTKVVLTVIAAALVALVCRDYAVPVSARQESTMRVNIVGIGGRTFFASQVSQPTGPALPIEMVK